MRNPSQRIIVRFTDLRDPGDERREPERRRAFVEPLLARADVQPATIVHGELEVDGEVLVRPEVVHDAPAGFRVDHVRVEPAAARRLERADPRHRLPPEPVDVRVVLDRERHVPAVLREHDAPPGPEVEEWKGIRRPVPYPLHDPPPD